MKEVTADVVEIAKEVELEVGPKDMPKLLQPHNKTWMDGGSLLMHEQRKWFLETDSTPGEDC